MIRSIVSSDRLAGAIALVLAATGPALAEPDAQALFAEHCAACHAENRLGGTGPALIPETLGRMFGPALEKVISEGRPATQMAGFSETLAPEQVAAIARYLETPLAETPRWSVEDANASRDLSTDYKPAAAPVFTADPMNITLVVETGDHHVSVLDGDTFEVLDRFATPFAVHGGPKFSPDGRYVFVMSRDGWVQKYDIWSLQVVGQVRAGLNSRNIAMSGDGKWLAVANYLPQTLTILATEDLGVQKVIDVTGPGGVPSRVSAVYQAPPRESFVLALKDLPQVWEVFYGDNPPVQGFAHDYRMEPAIKTTERFPVRKIPVSDVMDDFFFDLSYTNLIGASRDGARGLVLDLDIGKEVAEVDLPGMPHLGSGITWPWNGTTVMATPHLKDPAISVIDMESWKTVKRIETLGPGFFMRSHSKTPYAWADVFFGPNKDKMHIIDKATLEIVKTLDPEPGKTVAHVEFTKDGDEALVSIWEDDGAVIVYDAKTLEEIKRLPMKKPSGKYNVWNKISFEAGTSH
ncbi:nitrite reductase [Sinirhodobacter sp. WL0062]|uniref:Nitrite reductase n=1 Tax=Rhodobacter flavimaris TaxID=2907145 RepID=A0ABS8YVC7_9RHOB|nr:cytochrome D1 domain-containing protein [Sinirhodobacter sp. WL0062]MCE5973792.1 nitrite reductase [Sinirhodobacter sp. WL0062]